MSSENDLVSLLESHSNLDSLDKDTLIDFLLNRKEPGFHHLFCDSLKNFDLSEDIAQLIQIMINHSGDSFSYPIYNMLLKKAKKSLSFQIKLFLNLKCFLATSDENKASFCYFLCCDVFDLTKNPLLKNINILNKNRDFSYKKRFLMIKEKNKKYYSLDKLESNIQYNVSKTSLIANQIDNLRSNVSNTLSHESLSFSSSPIKETNRDEIIEKSLNDLKINENNVSNSYPDHAFYVSKPLRTFNRTIGYFVPKQKMPNFQGLMLFFVKAVSSFLDFNFFKDFHNFSLIFNSKKNFKNLGSEKKSKSEFKNNLLFLDSLVNISTKLKTFPINLRQKL